jgi:hypothetical protein
LREFPTGLRAVHTYRVFVPGDGFLEVLQLGWFEVLYKDDVAGIL